MNDDQTPTTFTKREFVSMMTKLHHQEDSSDWTIKRAASPGIRGRAVAIANTSTLAVGERDAGTQEHKPSNQIEVPIELPAVRDTHGTAFKRDFASNSTTSDQNEASSPANKRFRQDQLGNRTLHDSLTPSANTNRTISLADHGSSLQGIAIERAIATEATPGVLSSSQIMSGMPYPVSNRDGSGVGEVVPSSVAHPHTSFNYTQIQLEEEARRLINASPYATQRYDLSNSLNRIAALETLLARERYQYRLDSVLRGQSPSNTIHQAGHHSNGFSLSHGNSTLQLPNEVVLRQSLDPYGISNEALGRSLIQPQQSFSRTGLAIGSSNTLPAVQPNIAGSSELRLPDVTSTARVQQSTLIRDQQSLGSIPQSRGGDGTVLVMQMPNGGRSLVTSTPDANAGNQVSHSSAMIQGGQNLHLLSSQAQSETNGAVNESTGSTPPNIRPLPMSNARKRYSNVPQALRGRSSVLPFQEREFVPLGLSGDHVWLSDFLVYLRATCIEVFEATPETVHERRRYKQIYEHQLGLRCRFCAHLQFCHRGKRSSSFPRSVSRIYQSVTMMVREHFSECKEMPLDIKQKYLHLKANTKRGEMESMHYWVESAVKLEMVDTSLGIYYKTRLKEKEEKEKKANEQKKGGSDNEENDKKKQSKDQTEAKGDTKGDK